MAHEAGVLSCAGRVPQLFQLQAEGSERCQHLLQTAFQGLWLLWDRTAPAQPVHLRRGTLPIRVGKKERRESKERGGRERQG